MEVHSSDKYKMASYDNSLSDTISGIPGKCGILTVVLTDPLSQLLRKISGGKPDTVNSIGFYYYDIKSTSYHVCLYDIIDASSISWFHMTMTMESLLCSAFISKINFYPISFEKYSYVDDTFRPAMIEAISNNSKLVKDKIATYTYLLLREAGIPSPDNIRRTGYDLVNEVLCKLMKISPRTNSWDIISCPLLEEHISIMPHHISAGDDELKHVIEESRREIVKLVATFIDLYTSHPEFRSIFLTTNFHKRDNNNNLSSLLMKENALVLSVVNSLHTGIIAVQTLNGFINELTKERFNIGYYQRLPLSNNATASINVIKDDINCTFYQPILATNIEPLRDLGNYIGHMADSFTESGPLMIDIGGMIASYNDIVRGTGIEPINMSFVGGNHTISRSAIAKIPGNKSSLAISSDYITIPMYNADLTPLSETQLVDMLVYIDSLRADDDQGDTRFVNLNNEIVQELARRRRATRAANKSANNHKISS
jgi:hypothetical protein